MSPSTITLLFLAFAVVMFVWEKIPLALTAMIVCIGLTITGVLDAKTAFAGFVNSNVILCVAMFIVGQALFETGMANKIGSLVTRFAKTKRQCIIAVMLITGLMSGFLSNTGTAAVLIPVVIGIAASSDFSRGKLLMPLVFAAALGGNLSIIGAPGNLIGTNALNELGIETGFFEYIGVGLPMLVFGILYFAVFGYKLLPDNKDLVSADDDQFAAKDFSGVPVWKQTASLVILILSILAMIFEKQIGVKLHVSASVGAIILILTGVISEKEALRSIDLKTVFLFGGSLALASALETTGAGTLVADAIIHALGDTPSPFLKMARFVAIVGKKLPDDVEAKLAELRAKETTPLAQAIYETMAKNQQLAMELDRPCCQDTGVLQFWVKCGAYFPLIGELEALLKEAVVQATFAAPLRHNSVETFDEYNTKRNVGKGTPTVFWEIVPEIDSCEIYTYMAGGGCSLPGKAMVLMPDAGYEGVTRFVLDQMTSYGLNAWPPLLVGVGVATSVETAALLSKKALMRPIGSHNPNARAAEMEKLLEDGINSIGLGPQGMSGCASVMGVHIENTARHPSTIGVAVNVGCWSHRRGLVRFDRDLNATVISHKGVTL